MLTRCGVGRLLLYGEPLRLQTPNHH
jgi:hypothetical protein